MIDIRESSHWNTSKKNEQGIPNPFLGIHFRCCNVYGRIYRNAQKTHYVGSCPVCGARVKVPIGNSGSSARFFTAE